MLLSGNGIVVLAALLTLSACNKGPEQVTGTATPPAAPGGAAPAKGFDLHLVDRQGQLLPDAEVWFFADIDHSDPKVREAYGKFSSDQKKLTQHIGQKAMSTRPGVFRIPGPKQWVYVFASAGDISAEHMYTAGITKTRRLELAPKFKLTLHTIDSKGKPVPWCELRIRVLLDEQRAVIQPIGRTDMIEEAIAKRGWTLRT